MKWYPWLRICLTSLFAGMVMAAPATDVCAAAVPLSAERSGEAAGKRLVIVAVPSLSFLELEPDRLERMPNLRRMIEEGALGAMNVRTPERGIDDAYLTLGAGAPAIIRKSVPPLNRAETWNGEAAEPLYARYGGGRPEPADILMPAYPTVRELNERTHHGARPGLLGQWLRDQGIARYVFGNSDRGVAREGADAAEMWQRHAAWLLVDESGYVPGGDVGRGTLTTDAWRPFGVKTDYTALLDRIAQTEPRSVIVAELGDLNRLYADRGHYSAARFQQLKEEILAEMDGFLGGLMERLGPGDGLWLFSPMPNEEAAARKRLLTPWVIHAKAETRDRVSADGMDTILHSPTTRQPGIVAHVDFAPTVMRFFIGDEGELPGGLRGFAVELVAEEEGLEHLRQRLEHIFAVHRLRPKLLYPFVSYEIGVLLAGLLIALTGWTKGRTLLRGLLFSVLLAPAVFLVTGYVRADEALLATVAAVLLVFLSTLAAKAPILPALTVVSGLNGGLILLDGIFFDATGMKRSILGYDVLYGARYYGLGNEFMGVLAASAILCVAICLHLLGERKGEGGLNDAGKGMAAVIVALFFVGIILYMGAPNGGTNAGGAITVVIAFGLAWLRWFTGFASAHHIRWDRLLAIVAAFGALSLLALWLLNAAFPAAFGQESHIGRGFRLLWEGRLDEIGRIISRKLHMNWRLIGVSAWSKVFVTSLFVIAVLLFRPKGVFRRWQDSMPMILYGFSAIALGAIVALLVNDSGIVSAAIMIQQAAVPMLLFKLQPPAPAPSSE